MSIKKDAKVVLITGCSSGIGYETALYLARRGYTVIATMRNLKKGESLQTISEAEGLPLRIELLDVNDAAHIQALKELIEREYGALHALINNAGFALLGFFEALTDAEIRGQMETNFFGTLATTRAFLPLLSIKRPSSIVNVSSLNGLNAVPGMSAYSSSKFAMEGFSEALRLELLPYKIRVFLVEPGPFETGIFKSSYKLAERFYDTDLMTHAYAASFAEAAQNVKPDPRIERVSALIHALISGKKKSFRNAIGGGIQHFLRQLLPFSIAEKVIINKLFK